MPSVVVSWWGKFSRSHSLEELMQTVEEIGKLSHSYFTEPPVVRRYDETIVGNIILWSQVFPGGVVPTAPGVKVLNEKFVAISKAHLWGVEFSLYDPRYRKPRLDVISFVLVSSDIPELDGRLVSVRDRGECAEHHEEIVQQADWYLTTPYIDLRYYLEGWMNRFLEWGKHFYLPSLQYCAYEYNPSDGAFAGIARDDAEARQRELDKLKIWFGEEVASWEAYVMDTPEILHFTRVNLGEEETDEEAAGKITFFAVRKSKAEDQEE